MARILIVEDDADFRTALSDMLRASGHDTVEAENGRTALSHVGDTDLVITDVLMPEADGIEFLRNLRVQRPGMPVIAISGGSPKFPAATALRLSAAFGAVDVLYKPFRREELLAAVGKLLRPRPSLVRN